jgi:surface antigen
MKKTMVLSVTALVLLLSSCGTYAGAGAYAGAGLGSILGSAVGGIAGGWRGSDVGAIVGMAGGAILGAAIGQEADDRDRREVHEHYRRVQENKARGFNPYAKENADQVHYSNDSYRAPSSPSTARDVPSYNARDFQSSGNNHRQPVVDETNSGDDRIEF